MYANTALGPAVGGFLWPRSSNSQPSLILRMLTSLGVRNGDRVLEIGTGTNGNAGLLAHRFGDERVFSVDLDAT